MENRYFKPKPKTDPKIQTCSHDWELQTEQSSANSLVQKLCFGWIFPFFPPWDANFPRLEVSEM